MKHVARGTSRRQFLGMALAAPLSVSSAVSRAAATNGFSPLTASNSADLIPLLSPFREKNKLPAIAAGVLKQGKVIASGAVGVRKMGEPTPVTMADKFHIGSCTKAMTATLAAMLVEQKLIKWETNLAEVFPERNMRMDEKYRRVTLELLLTHRSGAPANGSDYGPSDASVIVQRLAYMDSVINKPPPREPGTAYFYSNAGYIIAGAMLERLTGRSWETLIAPMLFRPLGMTSAGFGPPSQPNQTDQPWGHIFHDRKFEPLYGDNPRALGPAGTVHCTVLDYLKFADFHVSRGARCRRLLSSASFAKLQKPAPDQDYAFGWMVVERPWAQGKALTHNGSNTMNYFVVWLAPKIDLAFAVAINAAGGKVPQWIDEVASALVRQFAG